MLAQRIPKWIEEGELRGEARGETRGEAKTLLKLLSLKFGTVPDWAEERINSADKKLLDHWVERVLVADTLDNLFA